jgi:PKD repeat protein
MPSAVPSTATPNVDDGDVQAIASVGSTMVIGGTFTSVDGVTRQRIAAFNAATGDLTSFAPTVDGEVDAVLPGPDDHSVYVGGAFTQVNSTTEQFLTLLDLNTGAIVAGFNPPAFDYGQIKDLAIRGNRLYAAGFFSRAGGKPHGGLASFNATTGALDPFMNVQVAGRHNDSGSGAQGWIGPWDLAIAPNGSTMVVTGNFKTVDGLDRDQVVMIDLTGAAAVVVPGWQTNRYKPYCFNWAYDTYVRGVEFSPDSSYFVITATGGGVGGTLCDATARFETTARGLDIQPTWVNESGGDTMWGVTITSTAIFAGGHSRWSNNPTASDQAGAGAVPRPGLSALDPVSGRPLTWNPGRNPAGVAVYGVLATAGGVYVGSNTDWIGNRKYKRAKIAFFPYSGGTPVAATSTGSLPGTVFLGRSDGSLSRSDVTTGAASAASAVTGSGVDWAGTRGAFMVGNYVYYGSSDQYLYRRTFDGTSFGAAEQINPYHDPAWATVSDNLGGTYDGKVPSLYAQLPNVTGMAYDQGRLYYTLSTDSVMHWRWFSPDSGIVDERINNVSTSVNFWQSNGFFITGGRMYYVSANGNLNSVAFDGTVTGSPTVVAGPGAGGSSWLNRSLFLYNGASPNLPPTAAFTSSCTAGACSFDASTATDSDGSIASYSWDFGDSTAVGSGVTPAHSYTTSGTYQVKLTVTDDDGSTASATKPVTVTVTAPAAQVSFVGAGHSVPGATLTKSVTVPASVQAGDTLVVFLSQANTKPFVEPPAGVSGLTQLSTRTNTNIVSTVWTKPAAAGDAGQTISVTSAAYSKALLSLSVYRKVDTAGVTAASAVDSASASHVSPTLPIPAGGWALSLWVDKSSGTTAWNVPTGVTSRDTAIDTGTSGRYSYLTADSGAPVSGTYGGLTATTDATGEKAVSWTVSLPPAP